jgi:CBS domain-containing protein
MRCRDLMNLDLRLLPMHANVQQAARLMRENSLGFLPICDDEGCLVGVLTDRDIAVRAAAANGLPSSIRATEIMTSPPVVCRPHEDLRQAESRMAERGISRLVVVDEEGHPVGVLSLTDILRREARGRALDTARRVLAREAQGPHIPIESVVLTPASPEDTSDLSPSYESSGSVTGYDSVLAGGYATRGMKEFPR